MKKIVFLLIFCCSLTAVAQQTAEEKQLQQTIETFFEGFHKQDTVLIKSVVNDQVMMQSIMKNREGKIFLHTEEFSNFLKSIASIPAEATFDEKIKSYEIRVEGNMANVWTPYEFYMNNQFSHCGVNNFQLMKKDGEWKIFYLVDTRTRENCK